MLCAHKSDNNEPAANAWSNWNNSERLQKVTKMTSENDKTRSWWNVVICKKWLQCTSINHQSHHDGNAKLTKIMAMFCFCKSHKAIVINHQQITKPMLKKEWPQRTMCIASVIMMELWPVQRQVWSISQTCKSKSDKFSILKKGEDELPAYERNSSACHKHAKINHNELSKHEVRMWWNPWICENNCHKLPHIAEAIMMSFAHDKLWALCYCKFDYSTVTLMDYELHKLWWLTLTKCNVQSQTTMQIAKAIAIDCASHKSDSNGSGELRWRQPVRKEREPTWLESSTINQLWLADGKTMFQPHCVPAFLAEDNLLDATKK